MNIAVIGTGYVGLVSGVCFAELGNNVTCVDKISSKIERLKNGESPIYEPGLTDLIQKNAEGGRLQFTTSLAEALEQSEIIILAVGTPSLPSGEANMSYIYEAAREIGELISKYSIVIIKSTVPVGTNEKVKSIIQEQTSVPFDIVSVPEFLREGSAVHDTFNPDRIVIGAERKQAEQIVVSLHRDLTTNIVVTDVRSAEMTKYASNAFLATKISFINEIANICEKVGANVDEVAKGMGMDKRIGNSFLRAGIGYGGSCFPKDTRALIQIAGNVDYEFKLLRSVVEVNQDQRFQVIKKLQSVFGSLAGKTIAIWGLAFKPETDDIREAPAIEIIDRLITLGAHIHAYDPIASDNFKRQFDHANIRWCKDAMEAAQGVDALCLLTEWKEFLQIDLCKLQKIMNEPILIDGRNVFYEDDLLKTKFVYYSVGRPHLASGIRGNLPLLTL
ncbi:UDP-glucose dehydrogenase family protein [Paenibacillus sp. GCM10023250]|uniref:UDP-glucose dehydrogenase family protein n=1 Tax=Paenibacillus sp. GCM10023250 TaxID=3252648 RepID=UPI0036070418